MSFENSERHFLFCADIGKTLVFLLFMINFVKSLAVIQRHTYESTSER